MPSPPSPFPSTRQVHQSKRYATTDHGKGGCVHAFSSFTFSFNSASSSVNSYISASDKVLSFLALFNFFSRSLILFFMSFELMDTLAFTSILLPAPSYTSSFG